MRSTLRTLLTLGIALATALVAVPVQSEAAFADPAPPNASWWITDDATARTGWPTNGVVFVGATLSRGTSPISTDEALAFVTVEVRATDGAIRPGTSSYDEGAGLLIWVGDDAFQPMASYSVTVTVDNTGLAEATGGFGGGDQVVGFQLTTGADPAPPAPTLTPLAETLTASLSSCCDDGSDTCQTPPQLEVALAFQGIPPTLLDHYPLDASIGADGICGWTNSTATCTFAHTADTYCYTITVRSLFDGSTSTTDSCLAATEVQVDETVTVDCVTSPDDGCAVVGTRRAPAVPGATALGLALLGLGLTWRRRRARTSGPRDPRCWAHRPDRTSL